MKWKTALVLSIIGGAPVPALIAVLKGRDNGIAWEAAIALGEIGDQASMLALIEVLKGGTKPFRRQRSQ